MTDPIPEGFIPVGWWTGAATLAAPVRDSAVHLIRDGDEVMLCGRKVPKRASMNSPLSMKADLQRGKLKPCSRCFKAANR